MRPERQTLPPAAGTEGAERRGGVGTGETALEKPICTLGTEACVRSVQELGAACAGAWREAWRGWSLMATLWAVSRWASDSTVLHPAPRPARHSPIHTVSPRPTL
jgi:hypothetical protein